MSINNTETFEETQIALNETLDQCKSVLDETKQCESTPLLSDDHFINPDSGNVYTPLAPVLEQISYSTGYTELKEETPTITPVNLEDEERARQKMKESMKEAENAECKKGTFDDKPVVRLLDTVFDDVPKIEVKKIEPTKVELKKDIYSTYVKKTKTPKDEAYETIFSFTNDHALTKCIMENMNGVYTNLTNILTFFSNSMDLGYSVKHSSVYNFLPAMLKMFKDARLVQNEKDMFDKIDTHIRNNRHTKGYFMQHPNSTPESLFVDYFGSRTIQQYMDSLRNTFKVGQEGDSVRTLDDSDLFMFFITASKVFGVEIHWLNSRPYQYLVDINSCEKNKRMPLFVLGTIDGIGHFIMKRTDGSTINDNMLYEIPKTEENKGKTEEKKEVLKTDDTKSEVKKTQTTVQLTKEESVNDKLKRIDSTPLKNVEVGEETPLQNYTAPKTGSKVFFPEKDKCVVM